MQATSPTSVLIARIDDIYVIFANTAATSTHDKSKVLLHQMPRGREWIPGRRRTDIDNTARRPAFEYLSPDSARFFPYVHLYPLIGVLH